MSNLATAADSGSLPTKPFRDLFETVCGCDRPGLDQDAVAEARVVLRPSALLGGVVRGRSACRPGS